MKDLGSNRYIIVYSASDTHSVIWASQPSDCKMLTREHIHCNTVSNMTLSFDATFMDIVNGPASHETLEKWHDAFHHILQTYRPKALHIMFGSITPDIQRDLTIETQDAGTYSGLWRGVKLGTLLTSRCYTFFW